jgi:hypothetical protein
MAEAFRSLTTCCCSAGWAALVARMAEAFRFRFDFLILEQVLQIEGWVFFFFSLG